MLQKGNIFLEKMMTARDKIATKGAERLPDNSVMIILPNIILFEKILSTFVLFVYRKFWCIQDRELC